GPGPQSCHLRLRGANSDVVVGGSAAFLLPPFDGADLGAIELKADSVACDRVVGDDLGAELLQGLVQAGLLLFGEVLEALFEPFEFGLVEAGSGSDVLRRYAAEGAGCAGQRPVDDDLLFTHVLTLPEKRSPFHTVLCEDASSVPSIGFGQARAISSWQASEGLFDSAPSMSCQCRRLVFRSCLRNRGRWHCAAECGA